MFIFNMFPFPVKQSNVLYSWLGLAALKHFDVDEICLLGNDFQFIPPSEQHHGVWVKNFLDIESFDCFDLAHNQVNKLCVPQCLIDAVIDEFESPIDFFNHYVKFGIQSYKNWLFLKFQDLISHNEIEAIITLCNDRSLEDVSAWLNIPVIHMESGSIRKPCFKLNTFCFDFSGVNGNTEANLRAIKGKNIFSHVTLMKRNDLLNSIVPRNVIDKLDLVSHNQFEIGVASQVEDDSNVIVYNNGVSQLDILYKALRIFPASRVLIRSHPLAHFKITDTSNITGGMPCRFGFIDESNSSLEFVKRCKRLFTLNSSVAIEGLLLEKPTWIFGDSPLSFLASNFVDRNVMNGVIIHPDIDACLNWFIYCYLVPDEFWMNKEYIRWRLSKPSELEIYNKHKKIWDLA